MKKYTVILKRYVEEISVNFIDAENSEEAKMIIEKMDTDDINEYYRDDIFNTMNESILIEDDK